LSVVFTDSPHEPRFLAVRSEGAALHLAPHRPCLRRCRVYCEHAATTPADSQHATPPELGGAEPGARHSRTSGGTDENCCKPTLARAGPAARCTVRRPPKRRSGSPETYPQRCRASRASPGRIGVTAPATKRTSPRVRAARGEHSAVRPRRPQRTAQPAKAPTTSSAGLKNVPLIGPVFSLLQ